MILCSDTLFNAIANYIFRVTIAINMQVADVLVIKKKQLSQINTTMENLKILLQIFCLDSYLKNTTRILKCWFLRCAISITILGAGLAYSLMYKIQYVYPSVNVSIKLTDVIQISFDYFQYIVDLFFVYKYGREISIEYYKQYESFDKILDVVHYSDIKKRLNKLIAILGFVWITSSAFDYAAWYRGYGFVVPTVYSIAYVFFLIKILTNLDLTAQIINIECRLRVIGDLIQDCYDTVDGLPAPTVYIKGCIKDHVWNDSWFYAEGCSKAKDMRSRNHPLKQNSYCEIKWLTRCFLLLSEQCTFINKMFGVRIVLNSLSFFIDMVRFLNAAVRITVGSQVTWYNSGYFPAVSCMFRLVACVIVLSSLVHHCEGAYRQQVRISSLIHHILVNKNPDTKLRTSVTELRDLINLRPICFNMTNFFTLNYQYLMSMTSVVVTYTIILLQTI